MSLRRTAGEERGGRKKEGGGGEDGRMGEGQQLFRCHKELNSSEGEFSGSICHIFRIISCSAVIPSVKKKAKTKCGVEVTLDYKSDFLGTFILQNLRPRTDMLKGNSNSKNRTENNREKQTCEMTTYTTI